MSYEKRYIALMELCFEREFAVEKERNKTSAEVETLKDLLREVCFNGMSAGDTHAEAFVPDDWQDRRDKALGLNKKEATNGTQDN